MAEHRTFSTSAASVYPHYVTKAERQGRNPAEVEEIFCWLTGYTPDELTAQLEMETTFRDFFADAPEPNPARELITGVVCGVRVEEVEPPTMRASRPGTWWSP